MCGIIGRVGYDNAVPYLTNGLSRLEYRGYDSAGIAFIKQKSLLCRKSGGRLENLFNALKDDDNGIIGIGHTRWATHGKPTAQNAHPHLSPNGKFAVVHNGIIENADELKKKYFKDDIFASETDTEVIAHLIEKIYNGDMIRCLSEIQKLLIGSYALGVLSEDMPETLFCTAKASPLIAAIGKNGNFIASDVSAVSGDAETYYNVSQGEICSITKDLIEFFDTNAKSIVKESKAIDTERIDNGKHGYEHYMMLEMMQQPEAVKNTLDPLFFNGDIELQSVISDTSFLENELEDIVIVACGSAYHAGLVGECLFENLCRIKCSAEIASEFRYADPLINKNTLAVFISQSGETADTLAALRLAKKKGARVLSIVNVRSSAIANESDYVIYTNAGREVAVATTKAYSSQLAVLYALVLYIGKIRKTLSETGYEQLKKELLLLPQKISQTIIETKNVAEKLAEQLYSADDMYFIGRRLDFAASTEGSLKYKEISYIHSEAYAAGELKHGTISLIEQGTPVIAVVTDEDVFLKTVSNIREVEARGAVSVLITFEKYAELAGGAFLITVPETAPQFSVSLSVIPLQFLSYYTAKLRGCDIDKPKNLAKSVTVE